MVASGAIRDARPLVHTLKSGCKGDICLVGENPDKELPDLVGARGDTTVLDRVLSCKMCVVNFVFPCSQLQGIEWGWPGRWEPDYYGHSPAS